MLIALLSYRHMLIILHRNEIPSQFVSNSWILSQRTNIFASSLTLSYSVIFVLIYFLVLIFQLFFSFSCVLVFIIFRFRFSFANYFLVLVSF